MLSGHGCPGALSGVWLQVVAATVDVDDKIWYKDSVCSMVALQIDQKEGNAYSKLQARPGVGSCVPVEHVCMGHGTLLMALH